MFKTIFQRLFWTITAIIFFVVAAVSVSMFGLLNRYVTDERLMSAKKAASSIEYLTTAIALDEFDARYRRVYDSTVQSWSIMVGADITVLNGAGTVFSSTNKNNRIPEKYYEKVLSGEITTGKTTAEHGPKRSFLIGIPIHYNENVIGGIFYFYPPGIMKSTVQEFSFMIFMSMLLAMLVSMCLVYFHALIF